MDVTATSAAATAAAAGVASSRVGLADDFDSFLQLLTAQLKAQDPLSPLDANQFTEQLVQFSGVEQAIKTNEALGQLVALIRGDQLARSLDYLGAEVVAASQTLRLGSTGSTGSAQASYLLAQSAAQLRIDIYDGAGRLVASQAGPAAAGSHAIAWDGRAPNGARLPAGDYRFEVVASDAAGQRLPVATNIRGQVDGVEIDGERLLLSVDGVLLPADSVSAIYRPPVDG
jgi:flagellar basal-body rod modification protein FlgD